MPEGEEIPTQNTQYILLKAQVNELSEKMIILKGDVDEIKTALWKKNGGKDEEGDIGLIPRVREHTKILNRIERLTWVILTAGIGIGILIVYQITITHPIAP